MESSKAFEYVGVDWTIEDYEDLRVYHARFSSLYREDHIHNIFLRNDPRKNDAPVGDANFTNFKRGGYISLSPEVEECRGDVARIMVDLGGFLKSGLGMEQIRVATNDAEFSVEREMPYVNCHFNNSGLSVFMINMGEEGEGGIVQDADNEFCYTITAENCDDVLAIEKFMIEILAAHAYEE
jgi:hypothetical protein